MDLPETFMTFVCVLSTNPRVVSMTHVAGDSTVDTFEFFLQRHTPSAFSMEDIFEIGLRSIRQMLNMDQKKKKNHSAATLKDSAGFGNKMAVLWVIAGSQIARLCGIKCIAQILYKVWEIIWKPFKKSACSVPLWTLNMPVRALSSCKPVLQSYCTTLALQATLQQFLCVPHLL